MQVTTTSSLIPTLKKKKKKLIPTDLRTKSQGSLWLREEPREMGAGSSVREPRQGPRQAWE